MRISKTILWLSVFAALLVIAASVAGIVMKGVYARETANAAMQAIGQDIVNLIAIAVLLISAYALNKGSIKAYFVWSGTLLYLIYAYVIYAFDVHYNSLFLVYVAILGLSFYSLLGSVIQGKWGSLHANFSANTPVKLVSVFLFALGVIFYLLWLREEVPALVTGGIPASAIESNLPTNPVHVLDLAVYLPAILLTSVLLWQRHQIGYLLAGPILVFNTLIVTGILAIFVVTASNGIPTSIAIIVVFVIIMATNLVLSILYIGSLRHQQGTLHMVATPRAVPAVPFTKLESR